MIVPDFWAEARRQHRAAGKQVTVRRFGWHPERLAVRRAWIANYEARAGAYAACRYVESIGSGVVHETLRSVVDLHDRESRALVGDATLA